MDFSRMIRKHSYGVYREELTRIGNDIIPSSIWFNRFQTWTYKGERHIKTIRYTKVLAKLNSLNLSDQQIQEIIKAIQD